MPQLTPYTTTDAVRGAIGVDATEIPDARMLDRSLDVEMLLWASGRGLDHAAVLAAGTDVMADDAAKLDYQRMCLAFMYAGASLIAESPVQFMQSIGDGKNQMKRYDSVDWAELARTLRSKADRYVSEISTYVAPVSSSFSLMGRASPTYDPITNA